MCGRRAPAWSESRNSGSGIDAYDALDRLETATLPDGAATYRYWPDGLEKGRSVPGVEEGRCYDAAGRLTAIVTANGAVAEDCTANAPQVSAFGYAYDANGNRTRQTEQRREVATQLSGAMETTTYGYDALDRLTGVLYPGGRAALYRVDAVGNRTGERELTGVSPEGVVLASYGAAPAGATVARDVAATFNRADWLVARTDAVDGTASTAFGYDLAGNLVTKEKAGHVRRLRWSSRDTLTAVYDDGVLVGAYDYDAAGQRVKRRTAAESVEYVLDGKHVLQEASGAAYGHPSYRRYHYGEEPVAVVDASGRRFIGTDALGSPTDLTSDTGSVAAARQYDAWGQYRSQTAPSASDEKLGYTGHQFDPETGLVYARARYYDADLGRFISRDFYEGALDDAPSLHRFMYVRGNPLRYTDPTGHLSEKTATWAMNREWERYQAAERGSPEANQALQRYQFYRSELQSAENNRIFNEEVTFPLAADAAASMVLGPLAKGYRVVRVALGLAGAASGVSDLQKASQEGGEQRTADIISGTGKVVGGGLMLAPEISKGASAFVEKVRALGEKVRAAFTAVEDGAAPGAVATPEQAPGRPAWGSVGAARAGDPFDPEPRAARAEAAAGRTQGDAVEPTGRSTPQTAAPPEEGSPPSRGYDRREVETRSGRAVRDPVRRWDEFLGPDQTDIDSRDSLPDPDRIWSADGERSIRFGEHEMNSAPNRTHYHEETWYPDCVQNILQRIPEKK